MDKGMMKLLSGGLFIFKRLRIVGLLRRYTKGNVWKVEWGKRGKARVVD